MVTCPFVHHTRLIVRIREVRRVPTALRRGATLLLAGALAIATVSISPARAEAPVTGVGSSSGGATVAALDLGSLLRLAAIGETSSATIVPANGTPTATETLEIGRAHV